MLQLASVRRWERELKQRHLSAGVDFGDGRAVPEQTRHDRRIRLEAHGHRWLFEQPLQS